MRRLALADGAGGQEAAQIAPWLTALATGVGAVIGAFGLWVANRLLGKAAFQQAMNAGFVALMERAEALHAEERRAWHEERLTLHGEIRNLKQTVATLTNSLRRAGVTGLPETEYPDPLIVLPPDVDGGDHA